MKTKKKLFQQNFEALDVSREVLVKAAAPETVTVQRLNTSQLQAALRCWRSWSELIYDGWLVAGYDLFRAEFHENAQIVAESNESFASFDVEGENASQNGNVTALSFLEEVTTRQDFTYYVANVFTGSQPTAQSLLHAHVEAHFGYMRGRLSEHSASRIGYLLYFHEDLNLEQLRSYCSERHGFQVERIAHDKEHTHRLVSSYDKRRFGIFDEVMARL